MASKELNCDMGEGYGLYRMGDDQGLMPHIHAANVACGFHASDPVTMSRTVRLAKTHGVKIGAHPSLPDREGFGRREMKLSPDELRDNFIYQIGALSGFLKAEGLRLNHVKPHGIIYGMAARDETIATAMCTAVRTFDVPLYGLRGTAHETAAKKAGVAFVGEFFADLDYDDAGNLIITREHPPVDLASAGHRLAHAIEKAEVVSVGGRTLPISFETVCVHSDTPNAVALAESLKRLIDRL